MIRSLDVFFAFLGLLFLSPLLLVLLVVGFLDTGSPLFRQVRVGRSQQAFTLVKFRTMKLGTASVASHQVDHSVITPFGQFLRKTKLDELPQLWNVLLGHMSLVGPRPCLFNQIELIEARNSLEVFAVRPGVTGLAQITGVDMSTPKQLAQVDAQMILLLDLKMYFSLLLKTVLGAGGGDAAAR